MENSGTCTRRPFAFVTLVAGCAAAGLFAFRQLHARGTPTARTRLPGPRVMAENWRAVRRSASVALLVCAAACSTVVRPASVARERSATPAFVALSVADLDATIAWYRGAFAMPVVHRLEIPDSVGAGAVLESAELRVELLRLRAASPPARAPDAAHLTHGIFKAGFSVPSLAPYLARFAEQRVTVVAGPFADTLTRTRSVVVADCEGNLLHLFEPLPRDR